MDIELGRIKKSKLNFLNKKYILKESDLKRDIAMSGANSHNHSHFFNIVNKIKNEINLIMFMSKYDLENYLKTIEKEERKEILIRNLSSENILKEGLINKHKTIIFIMNKNNQESVLLKKLENIYKLNAKNHIKVAILYNEYSLQRYINISIENQKEKIRPKNVSLFYLSYEVHFSIKADINIIHKHYDPDFSRKEFEELFNGKKIFCIRDFRDLKQENFFVVNKKSSKIDYCYYKIISNITENINLEDYLKNEITLKLNNF